MSNSYANKKDAPLIPRELIFGNPNKIGVSLRPDGKQIAYLAPLNGVLNIWVQPLDVKEPAQAVTKDQGRGLNSFFWAFDNRHLLYVTDNNGDENWTLHSIDVQTGEEKHVPNKTKAQTRVLGLSHQFPNQIMIGINDRDPRFHDVYMLDLTTLEKTLVFKNEAYGEMVFNAALELVFVTKGNQDGSKTFYYNAGNTQNPDWQEFLTASSEESSTTDLLFVDAARRFSYWRDARGRDKAVLKKIDLKTRDEVILEQDDRVDVDGALFSLQTNEPLLVVSEYDRPRHKVLDPNFEDVFATLQAFKEHHVISVQSTLDHSRWLVAYLSDHEVSQYYLFDRPTQKLTYLFSSRPDLESYELVPKNFIEIQSRDGLTLPSYLTLPAGLTLESAKSQPEKLPLVVVVHGGPWARDRWGLDGLTQWLANRGYAVLQVNFRGSVGFGKKFLRLSFGEWGAKMHEDILDGVQWTLDNGIADPTRVAIFGGSYGGYQTLWALAHNDQKVFSMGASLVGPSNLRTLIQALPLYWHSEYQWITKAIGGDEKTPEGQAFLESRSPLTYADQIKTPLLIAQGANDPRVKKAESDQIVAAMQAHQIPVTYLVYPNEGHGLVRKEDRLYFFAVLEEMLGQVIGGRIEPMTDEKQKAHVVVETNTLNLKIEGKVGWWQKIQNSYKPMADWLKKTFN